ncbi:Metallo-dependent phosphatase [Sistotremastrum niveocremeum HHB9708]|uniref:Metallo-dependent phosphatase n=1 Tax=Sistotremastrum niveocremeum HHB9708 TaxID=1314777 RepID=A0A165AHX1_9AGAM|nr:Metallo-dependent phosphatase [Sistotremastrum niveocremeum HHB9708]
MRFVHFNDVYRVTPQKLPGTRETIDVTKFATLLQAHRPTPEDGLVLFSGDAFSPSVESSITRGSHMVPVLNYLSPDVALTGNHDFDFGYPQLSTLVQSSTFPWLLSNVEDTETGSVPKGLRDFSTFKKAGITIGVIGLIEKEWVATVPSWPSNFKWIDPVEVGLKLSKALRDPAGPHKCDLVIALTHSRIPNDIELAKALKARTFVADPSIANSHGVDIIFGGHDHLYYVAKGCTSWTNYDLQLPVLGAEADDGVLVIKSGTDFRDLSVMNIELVQTAPGSVRSFVIQAIKGERIVCTPEVKSSEELGAILKDLLSTISKTMNQPLCKSLNVVDVRSEIIRTEESGAGNLFADIARHAYDDALSMQGCGGSDGVFMCAGTFRGDSRYGPGEITLGDILEILPFEDPVVVIEIDGEGIWDALESSLSTWPAQEGRFPVISGFRVEWDSRRPPGSRVLGVWEENIAEDTESEGSVSSHDSREQPTKTPNTLLKEIPRQNGGRQYKIVTREYMSQGHDGFQALTGRRYLVDDENGQLLSAIVRKYLLGAQYIHTMKRRATIDTPEPMHQETTQVLTRARHKHSRESKSKRRLHALASVVLGASGYKTRRSKGHFQKPMALANRENVSLVDCFDGGACRHGKPEAKVNDKGEESNLLEISPAVDGRLKDLARI